MKSWCTELLLCSVAASCGGQQTPERPTYYSDVAPILDAQCVQCHHAGGPAPFSLASYAEAKLHAVAIASATSAGRMPPWLPDSSDYAFADERKLSNREVAVLQRWAQQGSAAGSPGNAPKFSRTNIEWPLGKPDLILELPQQYTLANRHGDSFRNFVLPAALPVTRYVRAVDIDPGNVRVVHHLILSVDSTAASRQEDARDAEPGFDGMFSRHAAKPPAGFFVGWTPGRVARANTDDLVWPLRPGTDVVLQMHLRGHGQPAETSLRPRVALYFAEQPGTRTPLLVRLGSQTIDIPAGVAEYSVADSITLPVAVSAHALYPHAHYLAKTMIVSARLPDGTQRTLLRIGDWDFNWQDAYQFAEPVALPAGTQIRLRYTYDNSAANARNPNRPPERVVYGPKATDEMAELWLQVVPKNESEVAALQRTLAHKSVRDRIEGWQHLIHLDSTDAIAHASLARYYSSMGDTARALTHYRTAVRAQPDFASAQYNLAMLLEQGGHLSEAVDYYRAALRARPDHTGAHNNLGNVLLALNRKAEAADHFQRSIELDSTQAEAHNNLGRVLTQTGRAADAIPHFRRAIENQPNAAAPRFNLAMALASLGRTAESLQEFEAALRLRPTALDAYLPLAWLLATHPSSNVRRPQQAVLLAERAARIYGRPHPQIADVLGAAHAAAGNFGRASELARLARQLAASANDSALVRQIDERIELYERRRPYINPRP